ncbi:pseudaminic acid cytidylyltransferase [Cupriavidus sp. CuC1]|uniref:pseudaminic acid cytidylyltransferase n=1 Tax=Cupriavidus sp. CuC1 TaxID=3373131 RepID=UPI0037D12F26
MKLAIIPARGGSKRIPGKNVRPFNGKPIIAYSVEAALQSQCFDRVIVSTDDNEIAEVAASYGAEIPFKRPPELADDYATTLAVIQHALESIAQQGKPAQVVCCIYATAPFIRPNDLRQGLDLLEERGANYAFSVTSYSFPIQRALRITQEGRVNMFQPQHLMTRSQDLEHAYHDAGQFYWGRAQAFAQATSIFSEASVPVILPRYRVQDIDTPEDWLQAELMYRALAAQ